MSNDDSYFELRADFIDAFSIHKNLKLFVIH